jgi:hypothetical protein
VQYQQIWPGVDLVLYGNQRQLEYDFIVAPGANPAQIDLTFDGVEKLELDGQGNLLIYLPGGRLIQKSAPIIYQEVDGVWQTIAGGLILSVGHRIGFGLADCELPKPKGLGLPVSTNPLGCPPALFVSGAPPVHIVRY